MSINELKMALIQSDTDIFNSITNKNINNLCKKINKNNIVGIDNIDYESDAINYNDFIIGLIHLLDNFE